jgi:hypothetical protein
VRYILQQDNTFVTLAASLHVEVPLLEYLKYKQSGTLPTIWKALELVEKQLIKEDWRDLSQLFDSRYANFFANIGIIPIGIATPEDKKPRLYRHGSYMIHTNSQPVNVIVEAKETEPEIRFSILL